MTWTEAVRIASMTLVPKTCIECHGTYYVVKVAAGRSQRCHECQEVRAAAMRNASRKARYWRERSGQRERMMTVYKLVYDPCDGWSNHTEFSDQEMRLLLKLHYIEIGAMLERQGVRLVVAQTDKGDLCLEVMEHVA